MAVHDATGRRLRRARLAGEVPNLRPGLVAPGYRLDQGLRVADGFKRHRGGRCRIGLLDHVAKACPVWASGGTTRSPLG